MSFPRVTAKEVPNDSPCVFLVLAWKDVHLSRDGFFLSCWPPKNFVTESFCHSRCLLVGFDHSDLKID